MHELLLRENLRRDYEKNTAYACLANKKRNVVMASTMTMLIDCAKHSASIDPRPHHWCIGFAYIIFKVLVT